ncbi:MAG: hypothetical protein ACRDPY_11495 [Streptosporangiaceae bacterium]
MNTGGDVRAGIHMPAAGPSGAAAKSYRGESRARGTAARSCRGVAWG